MARITEQKKVIMQSDSAQLTNLYNRLETVTATECKKNIMQQIARLENNIIMA